MTTKTTPADRDVSTMLGPARAAWDGLRTALDTAYAPITADWKPSKTDFGWMLVLKQKKRTLVYLTPAPGVLRVAVILGERAVARALASALPEEIKALIRAARPYVEGRGIRFEITSADEVPMVMTLIGIKVAP